MPTVLVKGRATVSDVQASGDDLEAHWRRVAEIQPISRFFSFIHVTPTRVLWWPEGDTSATPKGEVSDVG